MALRILALDALGRDTDSFATRLEGMRRPDGRIGTLVNSTIWGVLALRAAGRPAATSVRYLLRAQRPSGGWAWYPRGAADSNDTAAAIEALRAAGVGPRSRAITRGLAYLRRLQARDGGFALVKGRAPDAQSTAWAIQAFVAAGRSPGKRAFAYLAKLRRADGSYRYSKRYAVTPGLGHLPGASRPGSQSFPPRLVSPHGGPRHGLDHHDRVTSFSPGTR